MNAAKPLLVGLLVTALCVDLWACAEGETLAVDQPEVAEEDESRPRFDVGDIVPTDESANSDIGDGSDSVDVPIEDSDLVSDPDVSDDTGDDSDTAEPPDAGTDGEEEPPDRDNDGVRDDWDAFPDDINEWSDNDGDEIGDNADHDDDNDGILDAEEEIIGADCVVSDPFDEDGDGDGILDVNDPYPLDPFPEFIINANDEGSFYFFLSNRDGTFGSREEWGEDISDLYRGFAIADFDNDGRMDFIGHNNTPNDDGNYSMWFFYRTSKEDEFVQVKVGETAMRPSGIVADVNGDNLFDIVSNVATRDGNLRSITGWSFLNNGNIRSATCAVADFPDTSCAFTRKQAFHMGEGSVIYNQWSYSLGRQALDIAGSDHKDLIFSVFPHGGITPSTLYRLEGIGDGTFNSTPVQVLVHNHAAVISLVFAEFTSDDIGDVIVGLDDDGDAGQAWLYRGTETGVFDTTSYEAFDIEPSIETGSDNIGVTGTARTFDFDFDGNMDIVVSHNVGSSPWDDGPSIIQMLMGTGDGLFDAPVQVGPEVPTALGNAFEIPARLCPWYE